MRRNKGKKMRTAKQQEKHCGDEGGKKTEQNGLAEVTRDDEKEREREKIRAVESLELLEMGISSE